VALAKAPGQVLFCSPIRPSGKIPAGWTLVEVGTSAPRAPAKSRKRQAEESLVHELPDLPESGTAAFEEAREPTEPTEPAEPTEPPPPAEPTEPTERPAEVVQNDGQFAEACKNLGWTAAQVKKMNPNALRYAALQGLDPKAHSVISDGSIFDTVKGRILAATTPKAKIGDTP